MPALTGLDVYEGQNTIDWPAVPDLTFVACKASQYRQDRQFDRNWDAMRSRAFPVRAAYHFITAEPASVQARRLFDIVNAHGQLLPGEVPALDVEGIYPGTQLVCDTRDAIEQLFQRELLPYIGYSYPGAREIIGDRPWWFPSYGISEERARAQAWSLGIIPHVWQWGGGNEGADVPGVTPGARDDSNLVLRPDELIAWAGSTAAAPHPTPPQGPIPTDLITHEETDMLYFTNLDGRDEVIGLSPDGSLVSAWEGSPGSGLGNFTPILPDDAPKFSGITKPKTPPADGRLAAVLAGPMGQPWGAWQNGPGGGWVCFVLADLATLAKNG